jgi:hypothetical protein
MKLYTEEQVRQSLMKHQNAAMLLSIEQIDYLIEEITPIELPSDEEIREERLLQFPDSEYANRANDRLAFYCGAKWMRDKIQGGNK